MKATTRKIYDELFERYPRLAVEVAKAKGMFALAFTGERESLLSKACDVTVRVPETETYKVQEFHLPVYHCLCAMLEEEFF